MLYKIYYGNGETFSSQTAPPFLIPKRNDVQVIVQESDNHGWFTQAMNDYYVWDNRGNGWRWWGVDIFGLYDYLLEPGNKCVLFGRTIEGDEFNEIFKRASEDTDFPKKTSFANKERK